MSNDRFFNSGNMCSVVVFAVILRWTVSLHSYSGEHIPPLYGDYEAQRHWMEITVNLPIEDWYFNTTENDLLYWGLDYPPLTAYHSFVNGWVARYLNPSYVKLFASRGYESYDHKFFMRSSVIVADVIYFASVIVYYCFLYGRNRNRLHEKHGETPVENAELLSGHTKVFHVSYLAQIAIALLYPGLILIDHGHFQYNSISLGATIAAVIALLHNHIIIAAVAFCLALNYKQMCLYYSLPFFIYMLSHSLPGKTQSVLVSVKKLFCLSLTVIFTFIIIWYPFLKNLNTCLQVLHRLFPLARGIFEDKVSNIWCMINVVFKLNQVASQASLAKICAACVLVSSLPSLINLFRKPSPSRFTLSLINVSLSFFLFSYQVHEKSILLVAIPVLLYFPFDPFFCFWFLLISNFSMLPLLLKDHLTIPFIATTVLFSLFVFVNINFSTLLRKKLSLVFPNHSHNAMADALIALFKLSLLGCAFLLLCALSISPPARYPDLWPLLISLYSCSHFCFFNMYFNYVQLTV